MGNIRYIILLLFLFNFSLCINEEGIIFLGYSDGTLGVTVCSLYYKILDEERRVVFSSLSFDSVCILRSIEGLSNPIASVSTE